MIILIIPPIYEINTTIWLVVLSLKKVLIIFLKIGAKIPRDMHADIKLKIVKNFLFKCLLYKFEAKFILTFQPELHLLFTQVTLMS